MVNPFGKIHFCAVLGGNAMEAEGSGGAAFKLNMGNNRAAVAKLATGIRYIVEHPITQRLNDNSTLIRQLMTDSQGEISVQST